MQRERLLTGFRWILVDEYQDIGPGQYELIAAHGRPAHAPTGPAAYAVRGRRRRPEHLWLRAALRSSLSAASRPTIRARPAYLVENYRSTGHIIVEAANALIAPSSDRMKSNRPITVDRGRAHMPNGGRWETLSTQ